MASVITNFAVRSSSGIGVVTGKPKYEPINTFPQESSKSCRTMLFSSDGKFFAYANGQVVKILSTENWKVLHELPRPKTMCISFSPKSTYFMTWETFIVNKDNPQGSPNLFIYKISDWTLVANLTHKTQITWELQWSKDEVICARLMNNDVIFYENANFEKIVHRINYGKIGAFSIGPGAAPYNVLCYTTGAKGQPALGRMFRYPKFDATSFIANKSFFQADKVDFFWNSKGNSALLMTSTEVDKTGASYYGKQTLHYMASNGNTAMVTFSKEGPIYNVEWSPKGTEFVAIYGFMPSKATVFNLKCEPVFELGTAPRNAIYYNPHGNILLLAGFGNLRGQVEIWDIEKRKQISKLDAPDTTLLQWCPDGTHFLTATTAPRLRIGNGYKIWHYSGTLLHEKLWPQGEELYDVCWKPEMPETFKEPTISSQKVEGIAPTQPQASKQAYRPPGARGKPGVAFNLHDEIVTPEKTPSKAAMKQKKKREAKKAKKLEEGCGYKSNEEDADSKDTTLSAKSSVEITLTGDAEKDKKIKNIKRKLDAIAKLKEQQASGKPLEINQLSKIKGEDELLQELKKLQV